MQQEAEYMQTGSLIGSRLGAGKIELGWKLLQKTRCSKWGDSSKGDEKSWTFRSILQEELEDFLLDWQGGCEETEVKDGLKCFGLRSWKSGVAITRDEEDYRKKRFRVVI